MTNKWPLPWRLLLAATVSAAAGCAMPFQHEGGQFSMSSQAANQVQLNGRFDKAYYRFSSPNHVTLVLVDGPITSPRQAVTIRLFWEPFAGYTPVDPQATNATVQYVVFASAPSGAGKRGHQVGIYSGAGFVYPDDTPGDPTLTGGLWQASVRLTDRSRRYTDQLGASVLEGSFSAKRNPEKVQQILHRINVEITQRLGYPRLIGRANTGDATPVRLARLSAR